MFLKDARPFVKDFIGQINEELKKYQEEKGLSGIQEAWISFCVMCILVTNSICFALFERTSLGKYRLSALSWMFRCSKIPWELLLQMSVRVILLSYGISGGTLVLDDSDRKRSKTTKRIFKTHKVKDKKTGGYFNGQTIIFLVLVTSEITIPVSFVFYMPDPALTAWNKEDKRLKKAKIAKKNRPAKPEKNLAYPGKAELAVRLLVQFKTYHPTIVINGVLADALYGIGWFMDAVNKLFDCQVISQMRNNQNVLFRGKKINVTEYFRRYPGVPQTIRIRGGEEITVIISSARLQVKAHGKKRFVVALKYENEKEYRYLVACQMSWRTLDIVQCYTLRWLVEVFISDFKVNEGWGQLTKQFDEEGSSRSLILSLLLDHCLLLHPYQRTRIKDKLPVYTVGSLQEKIRMECLLEFIRDLLKSRNPDEALGRLSQAVEEFFKLRISSKHMIGRDLGRLEPTPALKYKAMRACAMA